MRMHRARGVRAIALVGASLLGGCASVGQIDRRVDNADSRASQLVRSVGQTEGPTPLTPTVVRDNGIWIGHNTVKRDPDTLPALFDQPATFDRTVASLSEFAERITVRSGVPVKVSAEVLAAGARGAAQAGGQGSQGGNQGAGQAAASPAGPARIVYSGGTFKGLLDSAAARYGVFWKYSHGAIQFFQYDTRTFQISAIPGDASLNATVASSSGFEGAGGGSSAGSSASTGSALSSSNVQNTAIKSELSVFGNLEKAVTIMLSSGGKVVASPATGTITVSDTPAVLERVSNFLDAQNKMLARQVMVNVTVLAVTLKKADNYGIEWNTVYRTLRNRYGITNQLTNTPNSTGFSAGIINTAASKWAGTNVLIEALSQQGDVRRETTASVVTLNNQPVPVQVAKQTSYLKSSQTTIAATVGSSVSLTPGQVTTGFNMSILPHVLDSGSVMLQFSTDISSLIRINSVTSGDATIQTPEVDTRNFMQRVAMRSNETLIISGFEQTDDNISRSGVGQPSNLLLGGAVSGRTNKEVIVILVTPIAMTGA